MIRSNLFVRRIAAVAPMRAGVPFATTSSPAVDALVVRHFGFGGAPSLSPAIHSFSPAIATAPSRRFSSSDAATELGSILTREIEEEEEAAAGHSGEVPAELAELRDEIATRWTILEGITGIGGSGETGSGATVRMFRKEAGSKGAKIGIVFHCQDTEEDADFDENEMFDDTAHGESGDVEAEEEPAQAVRFGVTVSKGGKTVVLQCRSGADVSVESVMVRDGDTERVLSEIAGGEGLHQALYQGPEFTELAEDLQESFQRYVVEECGVDEDVAAFISMYADCREQEEYVSWMKTAVDILD